MYQTKDLPETKYYNTCTCNEYSALIGRHIIGPLEGTEPAFIERSFAKVIGEFKLGGQFHKDSVENTLLKTRKSRLLRYMGVVKNIREKRIIQKEITPRVSAFVKFEKTPAAKIEEGKAPRMVQARTYEYCFALKRYITKVSAKLKTSVELFRGQEIKTIFMKYHKNPEKASILKESWDSFEDPIALCLDQKAFDAHVNKFLLKGEHAFWDSLFKDEFLMAVLAQQIQNYGYTKGGIAYKVEGTRMSGEYTTSDGNGFINFVMLATYLEKIRARIHLDGDDSVVIISRKDLHRIEGMEFFRKFGMECKQDLITSVFEEITFCQCSPVEVKGEWRLVKEWQRDISRSLVCPAQYAKSPNRYLAGTGLCGLASNIAVPILQAWSLRRISDSGLTRPLGSVDKYPALDVNSHAMYIDSIDMDTRLSFARAFDITPEKQLEIERSLMAGIQVDKELLAYVQKYSKFHLN